MVRNFGTTVPIVLENRPPFFSDFCRGGRGNPGGFAVVGEIGRRTCSSPRSKVDSDCGAIGSADGGGRLRSGCSLTRSVGM